MSLEAQIHHCNWQYYIFKKSKLQPGILFWYGTPKQLSALSYTLLNQTLRAYARDFKAMTLVCVFCERQNYENCYKSTKYNTCISIEVQIQFTCH